MNYLFIPKTVQSATFILLLGGLGLLSAGCGSTKHPAADAAIPDGSPNDQAADGLADGGAADSSDADGSADGAAPTVVATLGAIPASLALSGSTLYFTVAESAAAHDGKLQSVGTAATNATPDGGVTTLLTGLNQPRAIAVNGDRVLWADTSTTFPDPNIVLSAPLAGGSPTTVAPEAAMTPHLCISGATLYAVTNNLGKISAIPLEAADAGTAADAGADAGTGVIYPGMPPDAVVGPDCDGTSVFFFTNGTTNLDLFKIAVGGGAPTDLAMNATSASVDFDFLVDDTTTLFWSDSGTGSVFSVPKAGGAKTTVATFATGSTPVQLALDGDNIYALSSSQLARVPKAGGTPVVLASVSGGNGNVYLASLGNAVALAVDATSVYWLYEGHGEILKIAK